jgi:hypothetical protein
MIRAEALEGDLSERRAGLLAEVHGSSGTCRVATPPAGCAELHRLRSDRDRFAALGTTAMVAGGILGAVTAASLVVDASFLRLKQAPAMERPQVSLMATPQAAGLLVQGVWGGRR